MPLFSRVSSLWRNVLGSSRADSELDEEVRAYARMLAEEKERAGMTAEEARRAAAIEVGGVEQVKESVRDVRLGTFLGTVAADVRYGLRALGRNPGFAVAAVLALALGIGSTAAIFSVVNAVLLRPLPYRQPDRLAVLLHRRVNPVAPANFLDWKRQSTAFEEMGAADNWVPNLTGGSQPESVQALRVTANILRMLGIPPLAGRVFLPEEEEPGEEHEVVLSHRLWQRRYAGNRKIVGQSVLLNGQPYTVVGVMPRGFDFPPFWATGTELWVPNVLATRAANRTGQSLRVFGRLKRGATLKFARAEMAAITARLEKQFPGSNREVTVASLKETVVGDVRPALLVLLAAVAFVLLIACANVAHMLLARSAARQREVAVRAALGASRARMIRQFLTESLVLASFGGAGGVLLALWGTNLLVSLGPTHLPRLETVALDVRVLAFTLGISLLTGFAFGLAPALKASRRDLTESLREGERGATEGSQRGLLRNVLIASEFALALVLLIGAGLMLRSFAALEAIDPGFDPRRVLTLMVSVAGTREAEPPLRAGFYRQALQQIRAVPGVASASAINHLPLAGDIWGWSFTIEGRPTPAPGESPDAAYRVTLSGYFTAMGIPILKGRDIAESDDLRAPGVVVVNEWLAKRHWPGENPLGKRITFDDLDKNPHWLTVVGVVKNTVRSDWAAAEEGEVYLSYLQHHKYQEDPGSHYSYLTFVVRANVEPAALALSVRRALSSLDKTVTISQVQTMEQVVTQATARPRFYLLLLAAFASIALVLAAVGIYGVISYSVSRRTHEIGLRMALGAGERDVLRLVVRQGMRVALAGAAAGLLGALLLTRLMSTLLYGVQSTDPATFLAVTVVLTGVAVVASYIPARRAARIDPLVALRHD
jgi:putative ABC transport system permease protein